LEPLKTLTPTRKSLQQTSDNGLFKQAHNVKIILFQPQIPQNTGNIVRTCHVTGTDLFLVPPLGFDTSDKALRRAGLDYWEGVRVGTIDDLEKYLDETPHPFFFFSSHAEKNYTEVSYAEDSLLIFGSEVTGLPPIYREKWPEQFLTIPMLPDSRCLNLSNAAAVVLYEANRQHHFELLT